MSFDQTKRAGSATPLPVNENNQNNPLNELPGIVSSIGAKGFDNFPQGPRDLPQWCLAGADKRPLAVDGRAASVTDPRTWSSFDAVAHVAVEKGLFVGYVLTANDPYTCIDLDVKDDTTQEQLERFQRIVGAFDSYTERSRSGRGLHIWVEGKVGKGRRRDGVEVYSQERFIICTGDAYIAKPIANRQEILDDMVSRMTEEQGTATVQLIEVSETETDEAIWQRGADASNGDKFRQLWAGDWKGLGYQPVARDHHAAHLLDAFNLECDASINRAGDDNSRRQMWNRAHLKALRIAALLAVADNNVTPCITTRHAEWAIDLVRRDIAVFTTRLQSGDIGSDDKARETKVLAILRDYLIKAPSAGYKVKPALHQNRIVPRKFLTMKTGSLPAFKSHKQGSTGALDGVLRSLCSSGYITKCSGTDMVKDYNEHGECYMVLDLPSYD